MIIIKQTFFDSKLDNKFTLLFSLNAVCQNSKLGYHQS